MKKNGFKYPSGMDDVVQDYVKDRWVFVAVKTEVGQKKGVNPRPGMKKVNKKRPPSTFTGHVQAMGFRYKSDKLVVPMRLSAFNEGELRNIVYVLTESAKRIDGIPKRYVRRQISGKELYKNLTGPLPVRIIGGEWKDLQPYQKQNLKTRRDPKAHNGLAKQLFAADMLALKQKRLSNPFEEEEKQLLKIGERLSLRGPQMDALNGQILNKKRDRAVERALKGIKDMTFTVVDGTFERETIAKENLKFANYNLPSKRNNKKSYDTRMMGPGGTPQGKLYKGASLELVDENGDRSADASGAIETQPTNRGHWGVGLGALVLFLGAFALRRRSATALGIAFAITLAGSTASAESTESLLSKLADDKKAEAAVAKLVKKGKSAVDDILDDIADTEDSKRRGWAIIALAEIGGKKADKGLTQIHNNTSMPMLVRTWAAAARVEIADTTEDLFALAQLASQFPAVQRPLGLRIGATLENVKGPKAAERLLKAQTQFPNLRNSLQASILKLTKKQLLHAMFTSDDNNVRRTAAAYIGSKASKDDGVGKMIAKAYRFKKGAEDVPWKGGALFLPGIKWSKADSTKLVDNLVRWYLWAEINSRDDIKQQLHNNLRSIQLGRAAGYSSPGWNQGGVDPWLRTWGGVIGKKKLRSLLSQQGVRWKSRYRAILNKL
jgi:hypothetical protein